MDADELLIEWAQKRVKPWLEKQLKNYDPGRPSVYFINKLYEMPYHIKGATLEHLLNCNPRVYAIPSHNWECGCYSEYTRDDDWYIHTYITCHHGLFTQMSEQISIYDLPEVLRQLADSDEGCRYDDPDY